MVGTFWLKMQEYSIILSSRPHVHEKPIFILTILGAHFWRDDWLARFRFLHLSFIFSTFINVELSSFYETYHELECSSKVTVTKWIPHSWTSTAILDNTFISAWLKAQIFFFLLSYAFLALRKIRERGGLKDFWEKEKKVSWTENLAPYSQLWKARLLSL